MEGDKAIEKTYQIYDAFRTLLLNKKYYAYRLTKFRRYNVWMEMCVAAGATGSGVAGLAFWQSSYGKIIWVPISAASVIIAIAKPLLKMTDRIEEYAKLYGEYTSAFAKMKILVDDIQVDRDLNIERINNFEELRSRAAELAALDDPSPNRKLIVKLQKEVNAEISIDRLWIPTSESTYS